jgi:hypothetical protein
MRHHTSDKDIDHQERPFYNGTYLLTIAFFRARMGGPCLTVPRELLCDRLTPSDNSQTEIPVAMLWMNPMTSSRRTNRDPHRIQPTHNTLHLGGPFCLLIWLCRPRKGIDLRRWLAQTSSKLSGFGVIVTKDHFGHFCHLKGVTLNLNHYHLLNFLVGSLRYTVFTQIISTSDIIQDGCLSFGTSQEAKGHCYRYVPSRSCWPGNTYLRPPVSSFEPGPEPR